MCFKLPEKPFRNRQGGFSLIEIMAVMLIIAILVAIAIPMYTRFITGARETAAVSYLNLVKKSEEVYKADSSLVLYSGSFDELETSGILPSSTGAATRVVNDYTFTITAGVNAGEPFWQAYAEPNIDPSKSKWFYADQTGVIRYSTGAAATAISPPFTK